MKILHRHVLLAHVGPFFFGFFTVIFVFLLQFLTRALDRLVGKGLELTVIVELILLQIAWMVVLAAPMGVLIACLMAFGKMTNDLEITAMRAGGISLGRLMQPVLIASAILVVLVERFGNVVLPEANHQAKVLMMDISRKKPAFGLQENVFSNLIYGYSILARKTSETSSDIGGVTIYDYTRPQSETVITAETGKFEYSSDYRYLIMTLYDGEMHEVDKNARKEYRRMAFQRHKVLLDATGFGFERSDESSVSRGDRELSASTMLAICDSLQAQIDATKRRIADETRHHFARLLSGTGIGEVDSLDVDINLAARSDAQTDESFYLSSIPKSERLNALELASAMARGLQSQTSNALFSIRNDEETQRKYMVEVHKKYSIPFACFCFALVGVPLGVLAKRGGFGIGAGLSLAFFLLYWAFLISGEKLADRAIVSPAVAMWSGNVVLMAIGAWLFYAVSGTGFAWLKGSGR
ncbi:MAG: LptF/LptG family permease [Chloroherpetonaceae bacterium]|nr:LptF/LptG family permease [Chloroherpetonaceae bacterium]